ncbi:PREDICTED: rab11 family-interacting protein 2 [Nanorana parkeri]|uniref:rab11 family-interacting protein 2 n=1 Tax=Nanorana parkeri TaxID=125878 RepID=UPI0008546498|nr:PREDICTED: rab11 family-interacting protein 2 [Nanorana parkeri]
MEAPATEIPPPPSASDNAIPPPPSASDNAILSVTSAHTTYRWYKMESKQGKKNKDRGHLKVNIQFMRNNMTASMFDLSMKDKTRSPFARLKDKMKGRKPDGSDTSSAIVPSTSQLHGNRFTEGNEMPPHKDKPKKPFLLGPQRLSSAHSMSDLVGPPPSRLGSGGPPGKQPLDSISSAEESGGLKSPHRRAMSVDTSKDGQPETSEPGGDWTSHPATERVLSSSIPQKFATLPRQWAPGDERAEVWDSSTATATHSKTSEGRRDGKKKDKVSLFERVTGKKDAKRSERHNQDLSDWGLENRGSEVVPQTLAPNYQSTNPFRVGSHPPEPRSFPKLSTFEVSALVGSRGGLDAYRPLQGPLHLTRSEVERELLKHKELLKKKDGHIRELEDYIDNLLVRVMEETPSILRVPYVPSRKAGKFNQS